MANTPAWFDEEFYLSSKLAQLRSKGLTQYQNIVDVKVALEAAGYTPFSHFQAMGLIERTSPNKYFNATEYLNAKAQQANAKQGVTTWNADNIALAIRDAGMTIWEHFQKFGWKEGVNPSNAFDVNAYFESKLAAVQAKDPNGGWTLEKVKAAFEAAGLDPITHYVEYGKNEEGVTVSPAKDPVPSDGRTGGEVFTLTTGVDNIVGTAGNDTILATINGADSTLTALDSINGGAGVDTLRIDALVAVTALPVVEVSNVENVDVRAADAFEADFSDFAGLQTVTVRAFDATKDVGITTEANATSVSVQGGNAVAVEDSSAKNDAITTVSLNGFGASSTVKSDALTNLTVSNAASDVTVTAAAGTRALTLNLDNVTGGVIADATATGLTINTSGKESDSVNVSAGAATAVTINAGADLTLAAADFGAAKSLTITGDSDVEFTTITDTVLAAVTVSGSAGLTATFASAALANVNLAGTSGDNTITVNGTVAALRVTGGSGADDVSTEGALAKDAVIDLGAGNDTYRFDAAAAAGAKVSGGTGTNTLAVANGALLDAAAKDVYSNFQILEVGGGKGDYVMANLPGLTAVTISEVLTDAVTISKAVAGTTLEVIGDGADLHVDKEVTYELADANGSKDSLSVTLTAIDSGKANDTADGEVTVQGLTAAGIETINIVSRVTEIDQGTAGKDALEATDYTNTITTLTAVNATRINIEGNASFKLDNDLTGASLVTRIDASKSTGNVMVDANGAAASVTFTGGAGDDTYTASGNGDLIVGGLGADDITLAAGNDTVRYANAAESVLTFTTNADGDITGFEGFDLITGFKLAGDDKIELSSALGLATGDARTAITDAGTFDEGASAADRAQNLSDLIGDGVGFFNDGAVNRAVATVTETATAGNNTWVFVDTNGDGNFGEGDMVIALVGTAGGINVADLVFG